jgi:hypothetical protein
MEEDRERSGGKEKERKTLPLEIERDWGKKGREN